MKTTKFFSILSLALIFVGITSGFSKNVEILNSQTVQVTGIRYQVTVHTNFMVSPCVPYLVQVVDETGRLVAPAQVFAPGRNIYIFNEKFSVLQIVNPRREALLVPVIYPELYICPNPLYTLPDVKRGPFLAGETYNFDLYPKILLYNTN